MKSQMNATEVREFLEGQSVYALDPATRAVVACIDYGTDGRCALRMSTGETDAGVYGLDGDGYWTRYETFRDGKRHSFRLDALAPGVAQAYFADGTIAFLQAHTETPDIPEEK